MPPGAQLAAVQRRAYRAGGEASGDASWAASAVSFTLGPLCSNVRGVAHNLTLGGRATTAAREDGKFTFLSDEVLTFHRLIDQ